MVSGLSVSEDDRRKAALTFLILPFLASGSVALGAVLSPHRILADSVFVLIVFAATTLRRRGPRWSAGGFLAFMTFFFSQFLHAVPQQVPWLALSATIGVTVAAALRLVVLPERPDRALRRLLQALEGQTGALLDAAIDVLRTPEVPPRIRRRAVAASGDLNRVALLVEEQLGIGPPDETESLRDRVFMLEVAAAHTVSAVRAAVREGLSEDERADLAREIAGVSRAVRSGRSPGTLGRWAQSVRAEERQAGEGGGSPYRGARHVRRALAELADAAAALQRDDRDKDPLGVWGDGDGDDSEGDDREGDDHGADEPDEDAPDQSGSDSQRTDPHLGLKQGVQATVAVALAIAVGELLSPSRWYWAAIAAYIVFVGADTRGATIRRAVARTVGTTAGLMGGLLVAALISGSKPAALVLIFVLLFAAWWLQPVSFFASSICVTIVLALLYVLLGTYSGHLLLLRVEETAVGAVLGGVAALILVPARSSPVVRIAEADVLDRIAELVRTVRAGRSSGNALRELDSAFQDLRDVARPVAKGVPGTAARQVEQRVFALSAASYSARMLVSALLRRPDLDDALAERLDRVADRAERLARTARSGMSNEDSRSSDETSPAQHDDPSPHDSSSQHDSQSPHADGHDSGGPDSALTHARVATERLDIALTRWSDPLRPPLPPGAPQSASPEGQRVN